MNTYLNGWMDKRMDKSMDGWWYLHMILNSFLENSKRKKNVTMGHTEKLNRVVGVISTLMHFFFLQFAVLTHISIIFLIKHRVLLPLPSMYYEKVWITIKTITDLCRMKTLMLVECYQVVQHRLLASFIFYYYLRR